MIENLKRIREPLAWAVIAIVAANIVLGLVELVIQLREAVPVFAAFQEIGASLMNMTLVLAVVALVCTCFFIAPATPRALLLTKVAAWVLTVGVLITLICSMLGVAASANVMGVIFEIVGGLLDLLLKGVAAGSLWVLLRGVDAGRIDTAEPAPAPAAPVVDAPAVDAPGAKELPATTWQRSEAAGAAWRTADDAASGAPGAPRIPASSPPDESIFRATLDDGTASGR